MGHSHKILGISLPSVRSKITMMNIFYVSNTNNEHYIT
jgi:hypothetical protein